VVRVPRDGAAGEPYGNYSGLRREGWARRKEITEDEKRHDINVRGER